jgi:hypothetical protein
MQRRKSRAQRKAAPKCGLKDTQYGSAYAANVIIATVDTVNTVNAFYAVRTIHICVSAVWSAT